MNPNIASVQTNAEGEKQVCIYVLKKFVMWITVGISIPWNYTKPTKYE